MDLRLLGFDLKETSALETGLLMRRVAERKEVRLMETMLIIYAIRSTVNPDDVNKINETLKTYRGLLFPELAEDLVDKAAKTKELLKHEFEKGPLKVESRDYDTKRKKKRR